MSTAPVDQQVSGVDREDGLAHPGHAVDGVDGHYQARVGPSSYRRMSCSSLLRPVSVAYHCLSPTLNRDIDAYRTRAARAEMESRLDRWLLVPRKNIDILPGAPAAQPSPGR